MGDAPRSLNHLNMREYVDQKTLKIGTRSSRLARWQSTWVAEALTGAHPGLEVALVEIRTQGDRDQTSPLSAIGGMGLFTKEIQRALAQGVVDLAVHSLKDLPTAESPGLRLGAIPAREAVADALIAPLYKVLADLPPGARVGTSSQRRRAQLLSARPDIEVVNIRGNVETRLNHAIEGRLDAVVLAEAGLHRLGLLGHMTERLGPPRVLPAVGQGALGIECRSDDASTLGLIAPLDDPATRRAVLAERSLLAVLEGGCTIPLGAWGRDVAGGLALDGAVFDLEGRDRAEVSIVGDPGDPVGLGRRAAEALRGLGAWRLLGRAER